MKRILSWLLVLALTCFMAAPVYAATPDSGIAVDGKALTFDVAPQVIDGVLMVPVRAVAEAMEGTVAWDEEKQAVTITAGPRSVVLTVGEAVALVDGHNVALAGKVALHERRTFVPASFLITFYGNRMAISHPAVKDPQAMALLHKSTTAAPTHFDMTLTQVMQLQDGVMTVDMTTESTGQVRGTEVLMTMKMKSLMLPPDFGNTAIAIKDGKQYISMAGSPWEAIPGMPDMAELTSQAALLGQNAEMLEKMVVEAHLGESRTENGRTLQDVLVTYDLNQVLAMFGSLLPEGSTEAVEQLQFDQVKVVLTIDAETGAVTAQSADFALRVSAEGVTVRMSIQQTVTMTESTTPIEWPEGLK